jgi:hypothetical protein
MTREEQESVFAVEVQKTLSRLASEFDLSTFFVIGALEVILLEIKQDLLNTLHSEGEDEEEDLP